MIRYPLAKANGNTSNYATLEELSELVLTEEDEMRSLIIPFETATSLRFSQ